jgi:elongation factor G
MEGVEAEEDTQTLHARVPLAEMLTYGSTLRSITQGRGSFHMEFSHYEEVPRSLQEKIITESKRPPGGEQHAAH